MPQRKPIKTKEEKKGFWRRAWSYILTSMGTIALAMLIPWLTDRLSLLESKLVYSGGAPPDAPKLHQVVMEAGMNVMHVTIEPQFTNYGFKRGHVDKIEVQRDGLIAYPERIEIMHVDKADIGWLEQKKVSCDFRIVTDPRNLEPVEKQVAAFKVYFYGPGGNELYWESLRLYGQRRK